MAIEAELIGPGATVEFRVRRRVYELPEPAPSEGELAAHRALQAVLAHVITGHLEAIGPGVVRSALAGAGDPGEGRRAVAELEAAFVLHGLDPGASGRWAALLLLGALLENPGLRSHRYLLEHAALAAGAPARTLLAALESRLAAFPVGGGGKPLPELLREPAAAAPGSIAGQLRYVLDAWRGLYPDALRTGLLRASDRLAEQEAPRLAGSGEPEVPSFAGPVGEELGEPRFSRDEGWMPRVVLIAKQTLVWLDQLSRGRGRPITRLSEIPTEELAELVRRGFNALWLIGVWERSPASREIKRRTGNPEAEASAYALWDYRIAEELGGEAAWQQLSERAGRVGLRLASDMVPNHVGLDSRWVVEHPDYFVQCPEPPFDYRFTGPDLCADERVGISLEDGYWDRSDAAVVFERVDRRTGDVRYLYHGNDGTQMPWNDTAQLDYLNPEVREAVVGTILEVARRFPIIRFDAAMTLTRKQIRRLWHPPPGQGGAIPSRSGLAATPEAFDRAMPREFWREVVERVGRERPGTLLVAEAFWLMEGYFVRDLGMHRVYNSAFMHMLRHEDNAGYRRIIKEVLAYSPAILERFVNFMNNPDEETAVAQFGKGDKYFGICTMMATLPGLPMFGHGQVEGFTEKYGMEFRRAYRDEAPDEGFVAWHEQVIFPLLRRREDFSGVADFALFDLETGAEGGAESAIDEDVFAYTNRGPDGSRSLVVYHNAPGEVAGVLRRSAPIRIERPDGDAKLRRKGFAEALGLRGESGVGYRFVELRTGRSLLRSGAELWRDGMKLRLGGYGCQVFLDWEEGIDDDGRRAEPAEAPAGAGVEGLDTAVAARHGAARGGLDRGEPDQEPEEPGGREPGKEGGKAGKEGGGKEGGEAPGDGADQPASEPPAEGAVSERP